MLKKLVSKYLPIILSCSFFTGLNSYAKDNYSCECKEQSNSMYQVALLQSLMQGEYDGLISVKDLKKHGDTGIGTFQGVNGEMIVTDGVVYQALGDGTVKIASDDEMVPFANVSFMEGKISKNGVNADKYDNLINQLDSLISVEGKNQFAIAQIDGNFSSLKVRSEFKQNKPYKPLYEVLKTDQKEFTYQNIDGTLVALYFPEYMSSLNMPGWHIHFISKDKTKGGHVLELNLSNGNLKLDTKEKFDMAITNRESFNEKPLGKDISKQIKEVE